MDVYDTVHTARLQFDFKMKSHSEKIALCERAFTLYTCACALERGAVYPALVVLYK